MRTSATLQRIGADQWQVRDADGATLVSLAGAEHAILAGAKAALIADHGFAPGEWEPLALNSYTYVVPS